MGVCQSRVGVHGLEIDKGTMSVNKKIEQQYNKMSNKDGKLKKLLLLGAGESGKSTIFRQITELYGDGFDDEARSEFTAMIFSNTITSMQTLLTNAVRLSNEISEENKSAAEEVKSLADDLEFSPEIAKNIQALWSDEAIKKTFDDRNKFQCTDAAPYFFERVEEFSQQDYIPTLQDILQVRVKTTGIVERMFDIEGTVFRMTDVGGQRNERKKWIHCFENVTAVLFITAINEYDQTLVEDNRTNRLHESLNLFEEICNSRWFKDASIILFLNKRDLFEEKIKKSPIENYFPEYDGDSCDYQMGIDWMRKVFESKCKESKLESIYCHITCATDTNNIKHVFNDVKDTVIRQSLCESGLMDSEFG